MAAQRVASAIKKNYQAGTLILVDGNDKTDRYYLPSIPEGQWVTSSSAAGPGPQTYGQICSGQVSIVVLRMTNHEFDNPNDVLIAPLVRQMYSQKTVAGKGDHKTMVWALDSSAKRPSSCEAGNVG